MVPTTMGDLGSCSQIGQERFNLSGRVGIVACLEPMQAGANDHRDHCFIGARSEVVEGCIVREGSVSGMAPLDRRSRTKIWSRETAKSFMAIPAGSVVVARVHARQRTVCTSIAPSSYKRVGRE